MTVNYNNSTPTDFDLLFEQAIAGDPLVSGLGVGPYYDVNGDPLYDRYVAAAAGTPAGNVGYLNSFGGDIGPLWANIGSVSRGVTFNSVTATVLATIFTTANLCYGGYEVQTDGDFGRRINLAGFSQPGFTDLGDITNPKGDTNATDFQFRTGNSSLSQSLSLRGNANQPPAGAIASQSWINFTTNSEWYFIKGLGSLATATFSIQFKHVPSGDESSVSTINIRVGYEP